MRISAVGLLAVPLTADKRIYISNSVPQPTPQLNHASPTLERLLAPLDAHACTHYDPTRPDPTQSSGTTPEVYDRPFNARDTGGVNHWDTTRNLPLIWATPGRAGAGFGAANTVMVDDTPKKMRFMDAGLVVVPEYTEACVLAACGKGAMGADGGGRVVGGAGLREAAAREQAEVMPRLTEYMR